MATASRISVTAAALLGAVLLAGCSAPAADESAAPSVSPSSEASAQPAPEDTPAAEEGVALTDEQLAAVFTDNDFTPDAYSSTEEMISDIYPGVTVSPACDALLGVGIENLADPSNTQDFADSIKNGSVEFGASIDRSLTAVVASFSEDDASDIVAQIMDQAAQVCVQDPGVTYAGTPIDATVELIDQEVAGADTVQGLRLTATVQGVQATVVGLYARAGSDLVTVVGWDPQTNEQNVPLAAKLFVEKLAAARAE